MASGICAKSPPAAAEYDPKGSWDTIAGLKTYVTGPAAATKAIIDIYDIFGPAPQTLQGADRLAAQLNCLVIVPDFFEGSYCAPEWMPPDTDEKKAALSKWREEVPNVPRNVEKLLRVRKEAGEKWATVSEDSWGVFGLCWGGKVAVVACGKGNEGKGRRFAVSGTAHPAQLTVEDAEALNVPHILLASPGEPADMVAKYEEILSRPGKIGVVTTYETMFHGWMGARSNLKDEKNRSEYERGYSQVAGFFAMHL